MAEIKCPNCGKNYYYEVKKCSDCGFDFVQNEEANTNKEDVILKVPVEDDEKTVSGDLIVQEKPVPPVGIGLQKERKPWYQQIAFIIPTIIAVLLAIFSVIQFNSASGSKTELAKTQTELQSIQDEYAAYKRDMEPYTDFTIADLTSAQEVREKQKAEEEAKAKKEAAAKKKKEEEQKAKGYETGITYKQLARNPDKYMLSKVKFRGKVIQVIEGDDTVQIRLAVNSDYDNILLGEYNKSISSSRILEDDVVTIYGISVGTVSYESTMGGTITIPGVSVEKIKR